MKNYFLILIIIISTFGCINKKSKKAIDTIAKTQTEYNGTASITQGIATTKIENIYSCKRGRKTDIGEIMSSDNKKWMVPAETNYTNNEFPFAVDLFNACEGKNYRTPQEALSAYNDSNIVTIDKNGELFTIYIFADNYFEMYINGIPAGKDKVPFTQFNSGVVKFKAKKPFTIAMKLVDWEEHLGIGTEANRGRSYHAGDGGMVAVIKDAQNNIIATTDEKWKAQTYYTAPITDLNCVFEKDNYRYSKNCNIEGNQDGSSFYALHWEIPADWMETNFNDSDWPNATTFTNRTIGVNNKPAYTNFTSIFDDSEHDAKFIWSTNVVLDNEVLVRHTIK